MCDYDSESSALFEFVLYSVWLYNETVVCVLAFTLFNKFYQQLITFSLNVWCFICCSLNSVSIGNLSAAFWYIIAFYICRLLLWIRYYFISWGINLLYWYSENVTGHIKTVWLKPALTHWFVQISEVVGTGLINLYMKRMYQQ